VEERLAPARERGAVAGLVVDPEPVGERGVREPALPAARRCRDEARPHGEAEAGEAGLGARERGAVEIGEERRVEARAAVAFDEDHDHVAVDGVEEARPPGEGVVPSGLAEGAEFDDRAAHHLRPLDPHPRREGRARMRERRGPAAHRLRDLGAGDAGGEKRRHAREGRCPAGHGNAGPDAGRPPERRREKRDHADHRHHDPGRCEVPHRPGEEPDGRVHERQVGHRVEPARERREGREIGRLEDRDRHQSRDEKAPHDQFPPARSRAP
jgi:hypothetical protein